ncbi:MAG: sugar phosphate nucleotidyltransferase, partial [Pirellulales bacterium]
MKNVVAVVLGGGHGTRLLPLTAYRAKPAVPLAGKYRLIDIPISNCLNSGINQIYVLTQFQSVSLHRHIRSTYRFDNFSGGFVEILAAQQTMDQPDDRQDWYQGTADAVRKNLRYLNQPGVEYVLVLSGDQLYRMDFGKMLKTHQATGADVTIAAKPVDRSQAGSFGIMRIDAGGRVVGFLEKPKSDQELNDVAMDPEWLKTRGISSGGGECLASMGIYLYNRDTLVAALEKTNYRDFGKDVFPATMRSRNVQLHVFDGYWEDIGTIRSFYDANLQLAQPNPPFELASATSPIYTRPRSLPPTR